MRSAMQQQKAISATVTGDDQKVGFRAMVMKQAIEYNLAGGVKNEPNMIVRFTLQGDGKRIDKAIAAIDEGTKRSMGSAIQLFGIAYVVGCLFWPWVAERYGRRTVLSINIAMFSIAMPIAASAPTWMAFVAVYAAVRFTL